MKCALLLVLLGIVVHSQALECGIAKVNTDKFKETLSVCVKNNETLEKIWEMATATISSESKEDSASSSSQENTQSKNARKTRETGRVQGTRIEIKERRGQEDTMITSNATESSSERSTDSTTSTSMETSETCIVHCIFEHLGLTDDNGLPDHAKVIQELIESVTGRELRVFLQESVDECFQQMDQGW
nr:odorant binding protein [Semanotus bifasciatus]